MDTCHAWWGVRMLLTTTPAHASCHDHATLPTAQQLQAWQAAQYHRECCPDALLSVKKRQDLLERTR